VFLLFLSTFPRDGAKKKTSWIMNKSSSRAFLRLGSYRNQRIDFLRQSLRIIHHPTTISALGRRSMHPWRGRNAAQIYKTMNSGARRLEMILLPYRVGVAVMQDTYQPPYRVGAAVTLMKIPQPYRVGVAGIQDATLMKILQPYRVGVAAIQDAILVYILLPYQVGVAVIAGASPPPYRVGAVEAQ
jgi:hypothetical protein